MFLPKIIIFSIQEKIRSGELKFDLAESTVQKQNIRKQFDLCENTAVALVPKYLGLGQPSQLFVIQKSHLILNGSEQQLMAESKVLLREGLADPISHDQTVRLKSKIRTALLRADEEEKANISNQEEEKDGNKDEPGKMRISNRNRRQTSRYIPLATKNYKNVADKIAGRIAEKRKPGRPKKKNYQPNEEALKELELKRECKALTARFGIGNIHQV